MPPSKSNLPSTTRRFELLIEESCFEEVLRLARSQSLTPSALIRQFIRQGLEATTALPPGSRDTSDPAGAIARLPSRPVSESAEMLLAAMQRVEALCACAVAAPVLATFDDPKPSAESKAKLHGVLAWSLLAVPGVLKNFNDSPVGQGLSNQPSR